MVILFNTASYNYYESLGVSISLDGGKSQIIQNASSHF